VQLTISSSGKLFAQIREGAPWDLFFSADKKYPLALAKLGIGVQAPDTYARGRLILLSRHKPVGRDQCDWLASQKEKIAVANPKTAPYGEAARMFLSNCGILDGLSDQLVYGESISQVNRFFLTESVDFALTAQSMFYSDKLTDSIFHAFISTRYYTLIEQDYLILKHSPAVNRFLSYMQSDGGQTVLRSFGYF
ncbi:MAG TPA: molybdate ABC transporter substrate-binding protein, partial [Saprospiraceae bacterium]|nr:molybdate ABC transporter substrate-binding protein [Saprospiraceae bacterium]